MKKILCVLICMLAFAGCSDMFSSTSGEYRTVAVRATDDSDDEEREVTVLTSPIVSAPENDPFTIENMNKALRVTLSANEDLELDALGGLSLEPNYLYVRFLADGREGAAKLKAYDTSLVLFKHPLDYKRIPKPAVYRDPSLPDSVIAFFATVPVDYEFGPTKYEVIKKLFLVEPLDEDCDEECDEETPGLARTTARLATRKTAYSAVERLKKMGVSLRDVEMESLRMTGNLEERTKTSEIDFNARKASKWSLFGSGKKLGGQLKFMDDQLGEQPLVGVRVTGGYSYYWRTTHTDKDGKFKIPEKWNFSIDYEANFDAEDFLLEDGHSWYGEDLEIEKNNKYSDWKETFTGNKAKWCVVWTAAYQYWYGDNYGLKRPRQNEWWNWSLDIEVFYKNKKDFRWDYTWENVSGSIGEYGYVAGLEDIGVLTTGMQSYEIYGTTIHEISHSSHCWHMNTTDVLLPQTAEFDNLPTKYKETYARGVENYFRAKRYNKTDRDYRRRDYDKNYTGLVEDLMDDNGSSSCVVPSKGMLKEKVSGFQLKAIEEAFFKNKTFSAMKKYLKKNYPSGKNGAKYTEAELDALFDCWGKLK